MPHIRAIVSLWLCLAIAGLPAVAAPTPIGPVALQKLLDQRIAEFPGTGVIVGVIHDGDVTILQSGTSGTDRPLDEHTLFEIGSDTKTFTATVLASMVSDGEVSLNDPVAKYLPSSVRVPSKDGLPITLLNLATQHSGLPRMPANFAPSDPFDPFADYNQADLYGFLNSYSLTRDPGAKFEYSNLGVGLLGTALSNRAGESYEALVRDRAWKPLGMNETAITLTPELQQRFARGYDVDGNPVHPWAFDALAGAGAIRSSASDMLKYLRCVMGQGPLGQLCLSLQPPRSDSPTGKIGLIWWIDSGTGVVEHGGDTAGFHAMIAVTADHRTGVVVLANGGEAADFLAYSALGLPDVMPRYDAVVLSQHALADYVGSYSLPGVGAVWIARDADQLTAQISGQPAFRIYPQGYDHFNYRSASIKGLAAYRFLRDERGRIVGLALFQYGGKSVAARVDAAGRPVGVLPASPYPPIAALGDRARDAFVGVYDLHDSRTVTIARAADGVTAQITGQHPLPLFYMGADRFFYKAVDAELQFTLDGRGRVEGVVFHQAGFVTPEARKLDQ